MGLPAEVMTPQTSEAMSAAFSGLDTYLDHLAETGEFGLNKRQGTLGRAVIAPLAVASVATLTLFNRGVGNMNSAEANPLAGRDVATADLFAETINGAQLPANVLISGDGDLNTAGATPLTAAQASWSTEHFPERPVVTKQEVVQHFVDNPNLAIDRVNNILIDNQEFYDAIFPGINANNPNSALRFIRHMSLYSSEQDHLLLNSFQDENGIIAGHTVNVIPAGTEFMGFAWEDGEWEHVSGNTYRVLSFGVDGDREWVIVDASNIPLEISENGELRTIELKGVCGNEQDVAPVVRRSPDTPVVVVTTTEAPTTTTEAPTTSSSSTTSSSTTSSSTTSSSTTSSTTSSSTTSTSAPSSTTSSSTTSTTEAPTTTTTDKVPTSLPTTTSTSEAPTTTDKEPEPLPTTTVPIGEDVVVEIAPVAPAQPAESTPNSVPAAVAQEASESIPLAGMAVAGFPLGIGSLLRRRNGSDKTFKWGE